MPFEVRMPQLGMNQDSATIVAWIKNVGDKVTEGEAIFEVETDKATMEAEARSEGYLSNIQVELGVDIPVGELIATIVYPIFDVLLRGIFVLSPYCKIMVVVIPFVCHIFALVL